MKNKLRLISHLLVFALVLSLFTTFNSVNVKAEGEANEAAQAAKDAIFQVQVCYTVPATGEKIVIQTGTGFLIDEDSSEGAQYVLTCDHVVRLDVEFEQQFKEWVGVNPNDRLDTSIEVVLKDDVIMGASVVTESAADQADWALLKLNQPVLSKTSLGINPNGLQETADVYALGFPSIITYLDENINFTSSDVTVTKGYISKQIKTRNHNYIQHSALLSGGNSGGPLLDANGFVVGINTSGVTDENASNYYFSLDINEILPVLDNLGIKYRTTDGSTGSNGGGSTVDKSALKVAIEKAQNRKESDYTAETWGPFSDALAAAKEVDRKEDAAQSEVDDAKKALEEAESNLADAEGGSGETSEATTTEPAPAPVSYAELDAAIADANSVDASKYDEASYADLQSAIDAANQVKNNAAATQAEVDAATANVKSAQDKLVEKSNSLLWIIIGIAAAVLVLVIILIIVLANKSKKNKAPIYVQPTVVPPTPAAPPAGIPAPQAPQRPQGYTPPPAVPSRPYQAPQAPMAGEGAGETQLLNEGSGETTLLSEANQQMAVLIKTRTGEKVNIGKREFKIGKERSKVDYCITNNSVSRIHAIITFENGNYYLQDNHSTNYTYLNGEVVSQKVMLNNNDRIKFSDEEFQFKLA